MKRSPEDIQSEFDKEGASRSPIQIEDIVIEANAKEELLRFLQKNAGIIRSSSVTGTRTRRRDVCLRTN